MRNAYCNCDFLGCKMVGDYSAFQLRHECCFFGDCQYQVAAQPQENKERAENSPATPVQQLKAEIRSLLERNSELLFQTGNYIGMKEFVTKLRELSAV